MNKCTESGCRSLEWKCADCGRVASTATSGWIYSGDFSKTEHICGNVEFVPNTNQWVSVKDRLPPDCTWCIAFGKRKYEIKLDGTDQEEPNSIWNAFYDYEFKSLCLSEELNGEELIASHWMPFPEPPKEQS